MRLNAQISPRQSDFSNDSLTISLIELPEPLILNVKHGKKPHPNKQETLKVGNRELRLISQIIALMLTESTILKLSSNLSISCHLYSAMSLSKELYFRFTIDTREGDIQWEGGALSVKTKDPRKNNRELVEEKFIASSFNLFMDPACAYRHGRSNSTILTTSEIKSKHYPYSILKTFFFKDDEKNFSQNLLVTIDDKLFYSILKSEGLTGEKIEEPISTPNSILKDFPDESKFENLVRKAVETGMIEDEFPSFLDAIRNFPIHKQHYVFHYLIDNVDEYHIFDKNFERIKTQHNFLLENLSNKFSIFQLLEVAQKIRSLGMSQIIEKITTTTSSNDTYHLLMQIFADNEFDIESYIQEILDIMDNLDEGDKNSAYDVLYNTISSGFGWYHTHNLLYILDFIKLMSISQRPYYFLRFIKLAQKVERLHRITAQIESEFQKILEEFDSIPQKSKFYSLIYLIEIVKITKNKVCSNRLEHFAKFSDVDIFLDQQESEASSKLLNAVNGTILGEDFVKNISIRRKKVTNPKIINDYIDYTANTAVDAANIANSEFYNDLESKKKKLSEVEERKEKELRKRLNSVQDLVIKEKYEELKEVLEDIIHEAKKFNLHFLLLDAQKAFHACKHFWSS